MRNLLRLGVLSACLCGALFTARWAAAAGPESLQVPPSPLPTIPAKDDIILYLHGGPGSRLEESADLVPELLRQQKPAQHYTILSFDQPSQGYSSMVDHTLISPNDVKLWDNSLINHDKTRYPMVVFSEQFVVDFMQALDRVMHGSLLTPTRRVYIIGGSTGGCLTMRMGHRTDLPWLKKIVPWNAASVWTTYRGDMLKTGTALEGGQKRWMKEPPIDSEPHHDQSKGPETPDVRKEFFDQMFGMPVQVGSDQIAFTQPNPEEWYRGGREFWHSGDKPYSANWACKFDSIAASRIEAQEVYNQEYRRWHWRLGTEVLLYSVQNKGWNFDDDDKNNHGQPNYKFITIPTLLTASQDDDWNEGHELHWNNRWSRTRDIAPKMNNTPGYTLFVANTGHSIHNERPNFFAREIVSFLIDPSTDRGRGRPPLRQHPGQRNILDIINPGGDEHCDSHFRDRAAFPAPPAQLLENPRAATMLLETAQLKGNFSDGKTPGTYGLRLVPELRAIAAARDPVAALVRSALYHYAGKDLLADAAADLAVTGRHAWEAFAHIPPTEGTVSAAVPRVYEAARRCSSAGASSAGRGACPQLPAQPLDQARLKAAILRALNRAYMGAWALRAPTVDVRNQWRAKLGWMAVSGEDDPPHRPVNVPTMPYPQYDLNVVSTAQPSLGIRSHSFTIRYTVAN